MVDASDPTAIATRLADGGPASSTTLSMLSSRDGSDTLLVVTNDDATEFRLARCRCPGRRPGPHGMAPVRPERPDERLERIDAFAGHAVLSYRSETQHRLRMVPLDALAPTAWSSRRLTTADGGARTNTVFDATVVTIEDQSYVQPPAWSSSTCTPASARNGPARHLGTSRRPTSESRERALPRRRAVPVTLVRHRRHPARRHCARPSLRLRRLRVRLPGPGMGSGPPIAARPGRRLRARARPRRR